MRAAVAAAVLALTAGCTCAHKPTIGGGGSQEDTMRDYAWGEVACDDLAVGLAGPSTAVAGQRYAYRIAIANRSPSARSLRLFLNLEGTYRTRLYLADAVHGARFVGPAFSIPSTAPSPIDVDVAAGGVYEADGAPFEVPADWAGPVRAFAVYGGNAAMPCEVRSGELAITIAAAP